MAVKKQSIHEKMIVITMISYISFLITRHFSHDIRIIKLHALAVRHKTTIPVRPNKNSKRYLGSTKFYNVDIFKIKIGDTLSNEFQR